MNSVYLFVAGVFLALAVLAIAHGVLVYTGIYCFIALALLWCFAKRVKSL